MVFSSFEFLFRFLPAFLILYYLAPKKLKNVLLLSGSLVFYAIGELEYLPLLLASIAVNYLLGRMMYIEEEEAGPWQAVMLGIALTYNFGILFIYKYSGMVESLPLGISFYTFQIVAYIIDVYRKKISAEQSFIKLGTYLTMFPQLIAGPIINYCEVKKALDGRKVEFSDFENGLKLLIMGLGAKVIIADRIGILWNEIRTIGFSSISFPLAWMGAAAFSLELYFDFAGYSLMARGLGRMLGFEIPANFNFPYMARSVSEFWRRWHITLSKWFREYVYIPLGGNRKGKRRTCINLLAVWSLTALWHGAKPNYLLWGASLLCCLAAEKLFLHKILEKSRILGHLYLILIIPLTWVLFAVDDIGQLGVYFSRLFPFFGQAGVVFGNDYVEYLGQFLPLFFIGILFSTPLPAVVYKRIEKKPLGTAAIILILLLGMYYLAISTNNPFLYFNF